MIDVKAVMKAYNDGNIEYVVYIRKNILSCRFYDKSNYLPKLVEMTEKGKRNYEIEQSVERTIDKNPGTSILHKNKNQLRFSQEKKKGERYTILLLKENLNIFLPKSQISTTKTH